LRSHAIEVHVLSSPAVASLVVLAVAGLPLMETTTQTSQKSNPASIIFSSYIIVELGDEL
jgi:hypothetical protein